MQARPDHQGQQVGLEATHVSETDALAGSCNACSSKIANLQLCPNLFRDTCFFGKKD